MSYFARFKATNKQIEPSFACYLNTIMLIATSSICECRSKQSCADKEEVTFIDVAVGEADLCFFFPPDLFTNCYCNLTERYKLL